jgi:hypothetical protein
MFGANLIANRLNGTGSGSAFIKPSTSAWFRAIKNTFRKLLVSYALSFELLKRVMKT